MIKLTVKVLIRSKKKRRSIRSEPANNEISFLKKLANEGKLHTEQAARNNAGTILDFIPNRGKTFYLLFANAGGITIGRYTLNVINSDGTITRIEDLFTNASELNVQFQTKGFSIVGDGTSGLRIISFTVTGANTATIYGYLENTDTLSSRGTTEVN